MSLDPTLYPPIPAVEGDAPRPFWSVVVPAYKSKYLSQALRSLMDQAPSAERMEILVIDDCSPELLGPIVARVGGERVRYIRQPENRGTYATENAGVAMARGQWIHIFNDDDWILPGFYATFEKSLANAPETVGAAFCGFTHFEMDGKVISTPPPKRGSPGIIEDFIEQLGVANVLHPISAVFRRRSFETLGGFNLNLNYCADWEFNKRVALHYDWWCEPRVMACYRVNPGNVSTQTVMSGQQMRDLGYAIELTEKLLPEDRRERITRAAREHYALYAMRIAEHALKTSNGPLAVRQIQEGLRLSRSPKVLQRLVQLLALPSAGPLREGLAVFFERLDPPPVLPSDPEQM